MSFEEMNKLMTFPEPIQTPTKLTPRMARVAQAALLAIAFAGAAAPAFADPPSGGPHKPPQEAFDACSSSKDGDVCSVTFHDKTMSGVCHTTPDGLACRPDGMPSGPPPSGT